MTLLSTSSHISPLHQCERQDQDATRTWEIVAQNSAGTCTWCRSMTAIETGAEMDSAEITLRRSWSNTVSRSANPSGSSDYDSL
jgi:hypothetical protein